MNHLAAAAPLVSQTADMPWTFPVFVCSIGLLILIMIVTIAVQEPKSGSRAQTALGSVTALATITTISSAIMTATIAIDDEKDLNNAQAKSVSSYLNTEFGIDVSNDLALRLSDGESFIVDYDGKPTTISLVETDDGHLGAVDTDRNPLTHR